MGKSRHSQSGISPLKTEVLITGKKKSTVRTRILVSLLVFLFFNFWVLAGFGKQDSSKCNQGLVYTLLLDYDFLVLIG